jgi:hypothetical protein
MQYRVTFRKRLDAREGTQNHPVKILNLPEGTVRDSLLIESGIPRPQPSGEPGEQDDDFLSRATEAWRFDIAPKRREEFLRALKQHSDIVLEYEELR